MKLHTSLLFFMALILYVSCSDEQKNAIDMRVSTFTREGGRGIYSMIFHPETGEITDVKLEVSDLRDPSFICYSPDKSVLYTYNNVMTDSAEVIAYRVDPQSRSLTPFSRVKTPTKSFCYISIFDNGKYLGVTSYNEGSSYSFPLNPDGSIDRNYSMVQHQGGSIHPRQKSPHAHLIRQEPQSGNIYVPDLGLDKIVIYSLEEGKLDSIGFAPAIPGSGPRHIAFHPSGNHMAAVNEIGNTVTLYTRDERGLFTVAGQTVSTLPEEFSGESTAAEICFSPDGTVLYASNRGHDSIVIFRFDSRNGTLETCGWATEGIDFPRNFAVDPTGKYLVVANQKGCDIVVYRIGDDPARLTFTGNRAEVIEPVCLLF